MRGLKESVAEEDFPKLDANAWDKVRAAQDALESSEKLLSDGLKAMHEYLTDDYLMAHCHWLFDAGGAMRLLISIINAVGLEEFPPEEAPREETEKTSEEERP